MHTSTTETLCISIAKILSYLTISTWCGDMIQLFPLFFINSIDRKDRNEYEKHYKKKLRNHNKDGNTVPSRENLDVPDRKLFGYK